MTKQQLHIAQMLKDSHDACNRFADELNPSRDSSRIKNEYKAMLVGRLDVMARTASDAFMYLTGKLPVEVDSIVELNTLTPAQWTKAVKRF